jgi:hypothetical protein
MKKADEVAQQMAVYAFEGPSVLYVHSSLTAAEDYFEAIDVENDEYVFFGQDGTVIQPSVQSGQVVLTPTDEQRVGELRQRLRTYLNYNGELDPELADDTVSLAQLFWSGRGSSTSRGGPLAFHASSLAVVPDDGCL